MARWLVVALGIAACGGDKEEKDPRDAAAATCEEQCLASAQGTDCDTAAVEAECTEVCGFVMLLISDDCLADYQAMLDCQVDQSYTCDGSVLINDVDWPVPDDDGACGDLQAAYEDCFDTTFSTTF